MCIFSVSLFVTHFLQSTNGVKVNGVKLLPQQPCTLCDGDHVQLGVPQDPSLPAEYIWTFHTKLRVKRKKTVKGKTDRDRKRPPSVGDSQQTSSQSDLAMEIPVHKKQCPSVWSPSQDLHRKLEEEDERMREIMREQEQRLEEMRQQLEEKDMVQVAMETEIRVKEEELREQMRKQKVRERLTGNMCGMANLVA